MTKQNKLYTWNYQESVTLEEYIRRLAPLVKGPVESLGDMEGDMMLSDLRKLNDAYWKINNLLNEFDANKDK